MSILDDTLNNRVVNVRTIAARVARFGEGISVREFLDALAITAGTLIRVCHRGPGVETATKRFIDVVIRTVLKG